MIKYDLHCNDQLLIVKYIGGISKSCLIAFFKHCLERGYLNKLKEILADYRDAKELYSVEDLAEITENRKKIAKDFGEIKTTFLVSKPEDTVIAHLYSDYYKDHSEVKICSTLEACTVLLSVETERNDLEKILRNPRFDFEI